MIYPLISTGASSTSPPVAVRGCAGTTAVVSSRYRHCLLPGYACLLASSKNLYRNIRIVCVSYDITGGVNTQKSNYISVQSGTSNFITYISVAGFCVQNGFVPTGQRVSCLLSPACRDRDYGGNGIAGRSAAQRRIMASSPPATTSWLAVTGCRLKCAFVSYSTYVQDTRTGLGFSILTKRTRKRTFFLHFFR